MLNLKQQQQQQYQKYHHHQQQQHQKHQQQQSQKQKPSQQSQKNQSPQPPTKTAKFWNQKKTILGQDEPDTKYVGNLSEDINDDLFELFGLRTTNYLRDNSNVQIPLSDNTEKKEALLM